MTRREKDRVATLERRRDFLAARVKSYRKDGSPDRDKAELHALNWALHIIEAADREGFLDDMKMLDALAGATHPTVAEVMEREG